MAAFSDMATVMSTQPLSSGPTAIQNAPQLPRRSTLVRKRDDDDEPPPPSPGKRAKVVFSSDVGVKKVEGAGKAPELIHEEVRSAFQKRAFGDDSGYEKIKAVYSKEENEDDEPSPAVMRAYTAALLGNVARLNKSTADL